ncbi:BnaC04g43980D [Brassica napus]|uniref:BnaC04g43980D protein n=1 Tax=Brassica napus TaxID=3708 RepID=A0A078GEH2_BRANA|nr:BnaC04g43980D [Brassica napus]
MAARTLHALSTSPLFLLLLFFAASSPTKAQQPYVNNHQLACENRDFDNITNGFTCNGPPSCRSYLTFWSQPPYNTPSSIAGLLNASAAEIQYLLTYLVAQGDSVSAIAEMFRSSSAAVSSGNELASDRIYFFTPLLVPLRTEPTRIVSTPSPTPPVATPPQSPPVSPPGSSSSHKWIYIGVGIGAGLLLLISILSLYFCYYKRRSKTSSLIEQNKLTDSSTKQSLPTTSTNQWSIALSNSSDTTSGLKSAIESLTLYRFSDLQQRSTETTRR